VGDHPQLGREALDVVGLPLEVGLGDQQGERGVLGAGLLDALVHLVDHAFPQRESGRPDHLLALGRAVLGQLGFGDDVLIPAREVLALRCEYFGHAQRFYGHPRRGLHAVLPRPSGRPGSSSGRSGGGAEPVLRRNLEKGLIE
jgi:hypothetical protein